MNENVLADIFGQSPPVKAKGKEEEDPSRKPCHNCDNKE
jgi:hypothetical protein